MENKQNLHHVDMYRENITLCGDKSGQYSDFSGQEVIRDVIIVY